MHWAGDCWQQEHQQIPDVHGAPKGNEADTGGSRWYSGRADQEWCGLRPLATSSSPVMSDSRGIAKAPRSQHLLCSCAESYLSSHRQPTSRFCRSFTVRKESWGSGSVYNPQASGLNFRSSAPT